MTPIIPLIPAEAGTQPFGFIHRARPSPAIPARRGIAQTWVPASAGMSGE